VLNAVALSHGFHSATARQRDSATARQHSTLGSHSAGALRNIRRESECTVLGEFRGIPEKYHDLWGFPGVF
jgi:hypothetical protein